LIVIIDDAIRRTGTENKGKTDKKTSELIETFLIFVKI
jgi:hypothetical protein